MEVLKHIDITREMIDQFPDTPNRTLAKMLRKRWPGMFKSLEAARNSVRCAKGVCGKRNRRDSDDEKFTPWARQIAAIEAEIPAETQQELVPFYLDLGHKYLLMADQHIPEHSKLAIETAVEYGVKHGCDSVFDGGDVNEHSKTSYFSHDPTAPNLMAELRGRWAYQKYVRERFKERYYSKIGNHEENLETYIEKHAPELVGLPCLKLEEVIGFKNFGITPIGGKNIVHAGKLHAVHGHEWGRGGGSAEMVNPARWLCLKTKACAVCFHFHRSSSHTTRRVDGFEIVTFSVGCLRMRTPDWKALNDWNWGFGILEIADNGDFQFENKRILSRGEVVSA